MNTKHPNCDEDVFLCYSAFHSTSTVIEEEDTDAYAGKVTTIRGRISVGEDSPGKI